MKARLDEFARAVIGLMRDQVIKTCDALASGTIKGPTGARWSKALTGSAAEALEVAVPDVVDEVIFALLIAIDNSELDLYWRPEGTDELVSLRELGAWEMAGDYICDGGWRDLYSGERFFSDVVSDT